MGVISSNSSLVIEQVNNDKFNAIYNNYSHDPSIDLFLNYTKGTEDYILLEFKIYEKTLDKEAYLSTLTFENIALKRQVKLTVDSNLVVPVLVPLHADKLTIEITFVGSDLSSIGDLDIDCRLVNQYS